MIIDKDAGIIFVMQDWITDDPLAPCNWHQQEWRYHYKCPCNRCTNIRQTLPIDNWQQYDAQYLAEPKHVKTFP